MQGLFGAILGLSIGAVSLALQAVKSNELQKLTEQYQKLLDKKKQKIVEQGNNDLDDETAQFFLDRLMKVCEGNIKAMYKKAWMNIQTKVFMFFRSCQHSQRTQEIVSFDARYFVKVGKL